MFLVYLFYYSFRLNDRVLLSVFGGRMSGIWFTQVINVGLFLS